MLVEDVKVRSRDPDRDWVALHGFGETEVFSSREDLAVIDLSPWVDEDGYGETQGGRCVRKKFTETVVLLENSNTLDEEGYPRVADRAYIGVDGYHIGQRYRARFGEDVPPEGTYTVFFPHLLEDETGEDGVGSVEVRNLTEEDVDRLVEEFRGTT